MRSQRRCCVPTVLLDRMAIVARKALVGALLALALAGRGARARSFAAGGRADDFAVYPADRVNVSAALELDLADGLSRFAFGIRWMLTENKLQSERGLHMRSPATMAHIYAAGTFALCEGQLAGCRLGYLDALGHIMMRSGGLDTACVAKGLYLTAERYLGRTDWEEERLEHINELQRLAVSALASANLTLATAPTGGSCNADGELLLMRDCVNSLEEKYQPQRELFRLLALSSPKAFSPRASDLHDLAFAQPSAAFAKTGHAYGADDGFHLLLSGEQQPELREALDATPAAHSEERDVFEIAHSCLPVDGGVARMRRNAGGTPSGFFCAWRRQHDANPAKVEVYSGWLDGELKPDGPPARLTPGDDPRLFAHGGRVHAVYNDAWVGDEQGQLEADYPPHNGRRAGGTRQGGSTVGVWLARFHVPAASGWEEAGAAEPAPSALSSEQLRSPLVMEGRVQLVPPVELRAPGFASSDDVFPFGKNYMPFSHGGSLHLVYSLSPLAIIECPDLSALRLPPGLDGGADEAPTEPLPPGVARRPKRVSQCVWSSLQPGGAAAFDPRQMGGLRGSTPVHLLPGGALAGLGHLRFNHMVATPFAFRLELARIGEADGGLSLAYPDPEAFASPVAWAGSELPAREANPANLWYEADGTARLLVSLKRGTDFMVGSNQQLSFQTALVNVSSHVLRVGGARSSGDDKAEL